MCGKERASERVESKEGRKSERGKVGSFLANVTFERRAGGARCSQITITMEEEEEDEEDDAFSEGEALHLRDCT